MAYNFVDFLKKADRKCKTKEDLIDLANKEIYKIRNTNVKPPRLFIQQLYIKRLEGVIFSAKYAQFRDKDQYNTDLADLLHRLS